MSEKITVEFVSKSKTVRVVGEAVTDKDGNVHPRGKLLAPGDTMTVPADTLKHPQGRHMWVPLKSKRTRKPKPKQPPENTTDTAEPSITDEQE